VGTYNFLHSQRCPEIPKHGIYTQIERLFIISAVDRGPSGGLRKHPKAWVLNHCTLYL
jgi:hypothetical protein